MTHESIVSRIKEHFNKAGRQNPVYLHYLCFIASITGKYEQPSDELSKLDDENLYYEVLLHLLKNFKEFTEFNRGILLRQMNDEMMYRRLSTQGIHVNDELKHLVMTERTLLALVDRAKNLLSTSRNLKPVLEAVKKTDFYNLKLVLHELNQDYLKCLKLFVSAKQIKAKDQNQQTTLNVL